MQLMHVCEVCGRSESLDVNKAYQAGWDYPPRNGQFGVIGPRTCPDCAMIDTAWAAIEIRGTAREDLTDRQRETLVRILAEPDSIRVDDPGQPADGTASGDPASVPDA